MSKAEKFIQEHTKNCFNYNSYAPTPEPWLTPEQARKAVEIAREEIYEWLSENLFNYFEARMSMFEMCLDDLKQAMKDE